MMLMPAAMLIVLLLGAIAVDAAIAYLEQRQAYNIAFDAANDAAGAAIGGDALRGEGITEVDASRAQDVATTTIAASGNDDIALIDIDISADGAVAVTVEVTVERMFGQAFGAAPESTLQITARAGGEERTIG